MICVIDNIYLFVPYKILIVLQSANIARFLSLYRALNFKMELFQEIWTCIPFCFLIVSASPNKSLGGHIVLFNLIAAHTHTGQEEDDILSLVYTDRKNIYSHGHIFSNARVLQTILLKINNIICGSKLSTWVINTLQHWMFLGHLVDPFPRILYLLFW